MDVWACACHQFPFYHQLPLPGRLLFSMAVSPRWRIWMRTWMWTNNQMQNRNAGFQNVQDKRLFGHAVCFVFVTTLATAVTGSRSAAIATNIIEGGPSPPIVQNATRIPKSWLASHRFVILALFGKCFQRPAIRGERIVWPGHPSKH